MRLDQYISQAAQLTRNQAREAIRKGHVTVDGIIAEKADSQIAQTQRVVWKNQLLSNQQFVYLMMDKPAGVLSAVTDANDTTVVDLVREKYPRRTLFPAGRLDKTSTGFVLLTDDGAFAHNILSPKKHVSKVYEVQLDTPITPEMVQGFAAGVTLKDGTMLVSAILQPMEEYSARVTLQQGVYHQIKRMFGCYHAGVNQLRRIAIGGVMLDETLQPGEYRELTQEELVQIGLQNP